MKPDFYVRNEGYAANLGETDPRRHQVLPDFCPQHPFHQKYIATLTRNLPPGAPVLDVGCGVGQVVHALARGGWEAHGVDVSEASIARAHQGPGSCQVYDGRTLPFAAGSMRAVGAFNVLEHVEEPVPFLDEMARVLQPSGRIVISSPNFLRVIGWRDYHPRMRGLRTKLHNFETLLRHRQLYREYPREVVFEPMKAIQREPMQPDDDATVATNLLDLEHYLACRGFSEIEGSCVDRPVPRILERLLDATPLRYGILNAFVTARKSGA